MVWSYRLANSIFIGFFHAFTYDRCSIFMLPKHASNMRRRSVWCCILYIDSSDCVFQTGKKGIDNEGFSNVRVWACVTNIFIALWRYHPFWKTLETSSICVPLYFKLTQSCYMLSRALFIQKIQLLWLATVLQFYCRNESEF